MILIAQYSNTLYDCIHVVLQYIYTSSQADLSSMLRDADDSRTVNDVLNEMMTRVFPELTGIQPELLFTVSTGFIFDSFGLSLKTAF